jgi:pimeloyl-ACP methyl ester carboxylesterase
MFVHGFRGNYLGTWGKIPELLRDRADEEDDLRAWDYLFIGYSTKAIDSYLEIASLISTNWRKASQGEAPFRQPYTDLALFGHSLGTLGIRQTLCATATHNGPLIDALRSVTLFGTPLNGSPLAGFGSLFYKIGEALKPENPQLRMLKVWSEGSFAVKPWPKVRVVLGQGDWVVGYKLKEMVVWPGDDQPDEKTLDHTDLVKPDAWSNCAVMDYLRAALKISQ